MLPKEILWVGAKGGLLAEKHYYAMREAIWLFEWLLLRQTGLNEAGEGVVNYGHAITRMDIQADTGFGEHRIKRWTDRLRRTDYIRTQAAGKDGLIFFVLAAKNKTKRRLGTSVHQVEASPGTSVHRGCINAPSQHTENKKISMLGGSPIPKSLSYLNKDAAPTAGAGVSFSEVLKAKTPPRAFKSQKEVEAECKRQLDAMRAKGLIQ